jgi:hypothetical protein
MILPRTLVGAALGLAVAAPAAQAADSVVATTTRPTPLAADAGRVLYSAWDGTSYRLTLLGSGPLPIAGAASPFDVDLGPGPHGHAVAVYPRCTRGETGCDLYLYDLETECERRLTAADSPGRDEIAGSVWHDRLVFTRLYTGRGVLYERSLSGAGASKRLADQTGLSLDLHGTEVALSDSREWSNEPWLASTSGRASRLTRVPGGGASVDFLDALNPTVHGSYVYWLLARSGDHNVTELHRYNRAAKRDERVATPIAGNASGFAYDGGSAYYAVPVDPPAIGCPPLKDCPTAIHRADGLRFEVAPPIRMR